MSINWIDLTGQTFGRLTAVRYLGRSRWECKCACGNTHTVDAGNLKRGRVTSCGCAARDSGHRNAQKMAERKNISGKTINSILVLNRTERKQGSQYYYHCKCLLCGKEFDAVGAAIVRGDTKSCGCYQKKVKSDLITSDVIDGSKVSIVKNALEGRLRSDNTSGVTGVSRTPTGWCAYITFRGERTCLYAGPDFKKAVELRKRAEQERFGGYLKDLESADGKTK